MLKTKRYQFKDVDFQFLVDVNFHIGAYRKYIDLTKEHIDEQVIRSIKEMESNPDLIGINYDPADYLIKKNLSHIYYSSILISIYSFLEKTLLRLCKLKEEHYQEKIDDFGDRGVTKYSKYLKKVLLIDSIELNKKKEILLKYGTLRNQLVHSIALEYLKNDKNKNIINVLKNIPQLTKIEDDGRIEFFINDIELLLNLLKMVHDYLHLIYHKGEGEEEPSLY